MEKVQLVYFSPTSTTKRILGEIAKGTGIKAVEEIDLTAKDRRSKVLQVDKEALVILGAPVYNGRVPAELSKVLTSMAGSGQLAACVSVYGNVQVGNALAEMMGLATDASLNPVAAASFIGEHSFSDEKRRIAQGRPDASDIGQARKFGRRLAEKVKAGDLSQPEVPGKRPEKKAGKMPKMASKATYDCDLCGTCMSVCPVGAIDGKAICDPNLCMACFACVKACPRQARKLSHPVLSIAKLALSKTSRKEPEIYV